MSFIEFVGSAALRQINTGQRLGKTEYQVVKEVGPSPEEVHPNHILSKPADKINCICPPGWDHLIGIFSENKE